MEFKLTFHMQHHQLLLDGVRIHLARVLTLVARVDAVDDQVPLAVRRSVHSVAVVGVRHRRLQ